MNGEEKVKAKKVKLNAVDAILLVLVICGMAAAVYFGFIFVKNGMSFFKNNKDSTPDFTYTLRIDQLDSSLYSITEGIEGLAGCPSLQAGDTVYDKESGKSIGKIKTVRYEKCMLATDMCDENGNIIYAEYPGFVNLLVTIEGTRDDEKSMAYEINGITIKYGKKVDFRTYGFTSVATVTDISPLADDMKGGEDNG